MCTWHIAGTPTVSSITLVFENLGFHPIADETMLAKECKRPNSVNFIESFWNASLYPFRQ